MFCEGCDEEIKPPEKVEKNKVRRINIVVPIETYGTRQQHTDALDAIEEDFRRALRVEMSLDDDGTGLSGFSVQRLSIHYKDQLGGFNGNNRVRY